MQIAMAIYRKFTVLDATGPFRALVDVPGHDVVFVAGEAGPVIDHTYDPQPPYDAGSPLEAPAEVVECVRTRLAIPAMTGV